MILIVCEKLPNMIPLIVLLASFTCLTLNTNLFLQFFFIFNETTTKYTIKSEHRWIYEAICVLVIKVYLHVYLTCFHYLFYYFYYYCYPHTTVTFFLQLRKQIQNLITSFFTSYSYTFLFLEKQICCDKCYTNKKEKKHIHT